MQKLGIASALLVALSAVVAACGSSSTAQCTTSKDCSHGFACAQGSCISLGTNTSGTTTSGSGSSTSGMSSSSGSSSSGAGGGPGIPPGGCLTGTNCVGDQDCAMGAHCNTALAPPQCEKLYCGMEGTACSETPDCTVGLKCLGEKCVPDSVCSPEMTPCSGPADCCSGSCSGTCQCLSCFTALTKNPAPPASAVCTAQQASYQAIKDCMCGPCASACTAECGGQPLTGPCIQCVSMSCQAATQGCGMSTP